MNIGSILTLIGKAFSFAVKIIEIIQAKGDDAGDVRLKDIEGFPELKAEADLHGKAVADFRDKVKPT